MYEIQTDTQIQISKHQDSHHMIGEEIRINSKLKHDHIIKMFGAASGGIHMNIFFECMYGGSILNLVKKGVFEEMQILKYFQQILLGVEYLRSSRILHRDLKGIKILKEEQM